MSKEKQPSKLFEQKAGPLRLERTKREKMVFFLLLIL